MGLIFLFNELVGHATEEKSKPRPFPNERGGHPEKRSQSLAVDSVDWYHPVVRERPQIKFETMDHPLVTIITGLCDVYHRRMQSSHPTIRIRW
jgi:hypothetical protein